jgi:transposase-like protein
VLDKGHFYNSVAEICRQHKLKPQAFSRWKAELTQRTPDILAIKPSRGDEQERITELERTVGQLAMELEVSFIR